MSLKHWCINYRSPEDGGLTPKHIGVGNTRTDFHAILFENF